MLIFSSTALHQPKHRCIDFIQPNINVARPQGAHPCNKLKQVQHQHQQQHTSPLCRARLKACHQRLAGGCGSLATRYSRVLAPNFSTLPTRSCLGTLGLIQAPSRLVPWAAHSVGAGRPGAARAAVSRALWGCDAGACCSSAYKL